MKRAFPPKRAINESFYPTDGSNWKCNRVHATKNKTISSIFVSDSSSFRSLSNLPESFSFLPRGRNQIKGNEQRGFSSVSIKMLYEDYNTTREFLQHEYPEFIDYVPAVFLDDPPVPK